MIGYIFVTEQIIAGVSGAQHRGHERARHCCWCCLWCPEQVNNVLTPKHTRRVLLLTMNTIMVSSLWSRVAGNGHCLFSQSQKSTPQQPTVCQCLLSSRSPSPSPPSQQSPSPDPKVLTKTENPQDPILWTGADTIITRLA